MLTDRVSIHVDRVKIFLMCSLIMQNLVIYHTVCMHVGGPKNFGDTGAPHPLDRGMDDRLEMQYSPRVIIPNFVTLKSNCFGIIMEIRQKILTPRVPPFKVTQSHWNRHGLISYL